MRWLLLTLAVAALCGCGASSTAPRLQHADAAALIALSHRIAGEGACAQSKDIPKLSARATALVNEHRVPAALQEPLISGVNALAADSPICLPSVPTAKVTTTQITTPVAPHGPAHHPHPHPPHRPKPPKPHGPGPGHGHGHGPHG